MSVQIDVSQGKHGDYLLITVQPDTVTLDWNNRVHRHEATLCDSDIAMVKAMVKADPRLGDRRPGVTGVYKAAGLEGVVCPLDHQQWRDIRGLTHSDP